MGTPTVTRSRTWFFEVSIPRIISESSGTNSLEMATKVAKEAYEAQAEHITALEKREEAMSDILHEMVNRCTACEIAKQAKILLEKK